MSGIINCWLVGPLFAKISKARTANFLWFFYFFGVVSNFLVVTNLPHTGTLKASCGSVWCLVDYQEPHESAGSVKSEGNNTGTSVPSRVRNLRMKCEIFGQILLI